MRIRKPRYLTTGQIALVTILGVLGGVYIWKPLILRYKFEKTTETDTETKWCEIFIFEKYRGHPIMLFLGIGFLSGSFIIGYKAVVKPYLDEKKRINAQLMAEYLFEKETQSTNRNQSNVE